MLQEFRIVGADQKDGVSYTTHWLPLINRTWKTRVTGIYHKNQRERYRFQYTPAASWDWNIHLLIYHEFKWLMYVNIPYIRRESGSTILGFITTIWDMFCWKLFLVESYILSSPQVTLAPPVRSLLKLKPVDKGRGWMQSASPDRNGVWMVLED